MQTFILAITGPAGSGKSTIANKLADASFYDDFVKIDSTSHTIDETIVDIKKVLEAKE